MTDVPPASMRVARTVWRAGVVTADGRELAEETPVAFSYDGAAHAVMMASPADLEDFAVGFSLTEGIIITEGEISEMEIAPVSGGISARMWLTDRPSEAFAARRRRYVGPAGCGMCGLESIAEAIRDVPRVAATLRVSDAAISAALAGMPGQQRLNRATHAVHAAGFWRPGAAPILREDVGRHNALDKLAGALARAGIGAGEGMVVMTSRLSVELVQKAAMMGVPVLVGVSAPTGLAVRTAAACGITLVGIAREDGFEVFTEGWRISAEASAHVG